MQYVDGNNCTCQIAFYESLYLIIQALFIVDISISLQQLEIQTEGNETTNSEFTYNYYSQDLNTD